MRSKAAPLIIEFVRSNTNATSQQIREYLAAVNVGAIRKRVNTATTGPSLIALNLLLGKMVSAGMLQRGQQGKKFTYTVPATVMPGGA